MPSAHRRILAATVLMLGLTSCAAPLPGWKVRAEPAASCELLRQVVARDASGTLRQVDHPRELGPAAWDQVEQGHYQIVRGEGGWWLAEQGRISYERGQMRGRLLWLADGDAAPEKVGLGRYAGVMMAGGEAIVVRGDCPMSPRDGYRPAFTVVERMTRNGAAWTATQVKRVAGLCPFNVLADAQGRPLVLAMVRHAREEVLELYRLDDAPLRSLGRISARPDWDEGVQTNWSAHGEMLLTQGWVNYETPIEEMEWVPPPGRVIDLNGAQDGADALRSSYLARKCGGRQRWSPSPPRTPERELGIRVSAAREGRLAWVNLLPDFPDLGLVVDELVRRDEPVEFEVLGVDLRGQEAQLLRLPAGSTVHLSDPDLSAWLSEAQPTLSPQSAPSSPAPG